MNVDEMFFFFIKAGKNGEVISKNLTLILEELSQAT